MVSVGGGLGSFALVDQLRSLGTSTDSIAVVSIFETPYRRLKTLLENSQVKSTDRLRSDSQARIDNPWGFPSYSMSEARTRKSLAPLARAALEPIVMEYFTPRADLVYRGLERESGRIAWTSMVSLGPALAIRCSRGGGYYIVKICDQSWRRLVSNLPKLPLTNNNDQVDWELSPCMNTDIREIVAREFPGTLEWVRDNLSLSPWINQECFRKGDLPNHLEILESRYVHLASGYTSLNLDAAIFGDSQRPVHVGETKVVHTYHPHDVDLESCIKEDSPVIVRGAGIAASQELNRAIELRRTNRSRSKIIHVVNSGDDIALSDTTAIEDLKLSKLSKLPVRKFPFVFPRGAASGSLAKELTRKTPRDLVGTIAALGRPSSPKRKVWESNTSLAQDQGWLTTLAGTLVIDHSQDQAVPELMIDGKHDRITVKRGLLIDCTGLKCDVDEDLLTDDLLACGIGHKNSLGRLYVDQQFRVNVNNHDGALFASGPLILGCSYAPVDSFWGLQFVAQEILSQLDLAPKILSRGQKNTLVAWFSWIRGARP